MNGVYFAGVIRAKSTGRCSHGRQTLENISFGQSDNERDLTFNPRPFWSVYRFHSADVCWDLGNCQFA